MKTIEELKMMLIEHKGELGGRFKVKEIGISALPSEERGREEATLMFSLILKREQTFLT